MYKYFHLSQNLCVCANRARRMKTTNNEEQEREREFSDISWSHLHQGAEMLVLNVRSTTLDGTNQMCTHCDAKSYEQFIFEKWLCVHLALNIWSKNRGGTLVLWPLQYIICVVFVYLKYPHRFLSTRIIQQLCGGEQHCRREWNGDVYEKMPRNVCSESTRTRKKNTL